MKKGDVQSGIKIARISGNLSQTDVVKLANKELPETEHLTANVYSKIESGWRRSLSGVQIRALSRVLGMTEESFKMGGISER